MTMDRFDRAFPLEGIEILSRAKGGDGRTVEAYAAVFDTPAEIHDQHGDYMEVIHRTAFNRTLKNGAVERALVLYNHGRNVVNGQVDSLAQVPLGSPLEIVADIRGLKTVTRYNKSALAESVLEAVRAGDIKAQSFRGGIYRSDPNGKVPRSRSGVLPTVTRMELGLSDYGPTPSPYYKDAAILAVRSATDVASVITEMFQGLDEDERQVLLRALDTTRRVGDPDPATATSTTEPGTEDPRTSAHSGRSKDLARQRELAVWAELARMEMAIHGQATVGDHR
jgi:HK97 family phage prohead protease